MSDALQDYKVFSHHGCLLLVTQCSLLNTEQVAARWLQTSEASLMDSTAALPVRREMPVVAQQVSQVSVGENVLLPSLELPRRRQAGSASQTSGALGIWCQAERADCFQVRGMSLNLNQLLNKPTDLGAVSLLD